MVFNKQAALTSYGQLRVSILLSHKDPCVKVFVPSMWHYQGMENLVVSSHMMMCPWRGCRDSFSLAFSHKVTGPLPSLRKVRTVTKAESQEEFLLACSSYLLCILCIQLGATCPGLAPPTLGSAQTPQSLIKKTLT